MFWTFSYQIAQGLVLILFLVTLLLAAYGFDWPGYEERIALALEMNLDRSFLLVGVTGLGGLFILIPLVRLRLGGRFRELIGWRTPRHEELIFAFATVIPIAVLGDMLFEISKSWWSSSITQRLLNDLVQSSSIEFIRVSIQSVPYPVLIVALALGPALGEEIVFRGLIGRGLVQRFGPWKGSAVTVLLFALAHTSPTHAIATIPIAILLQFLYLKTRTIWIPIFIHFCNNLLAVSMMRFKLVPDLQVSPLIAVVFFCYLIGLLIIFERRQQTWSTS